MDSGRSRKLQSTSNAGPGVVEQHLKYPQRLSFYERPPLGEVTLEDFETWAIDRLRVLAEIEASFIRNRSTLELKSIIKLQTDKYLPLSANTAFTRDLDGERKKDHVSHFILRLAFCRSEELKRRFVKAEVTLFKFRYEDETREGQQAFSSTQQQQQNAASNASSETVSPEEKQRLREQLAVASNMPLKIVDEENYIKVPWTKVPSLVQQRRVFLSKGLAYVPASHQSTVVYQDFQTRLEKALDETEKSLPRLDEDDRLIPILEHLSRGFLAGVTSEYNSGDEVADGDRVTAEMVEEMSRKHWPMCMRNLQEQLKRDKHLKHYARLQYGLFLKGVGMSVEEAMIFWRKSFSSVSDDKFNKEYRYNIRHSYGLEGKRNNYPAKSCQTIIMNNQPGPQDSHGCPFRHFSPENLTLALSAHYKVSSPADVKEILEAVKAQKYHVACTRVFEITHNVPAREGVGEGESVTHPNKYAARSRELEQIRAGGGVVAPAPVPKKEEEIDEMDVDI
ncbi:hypothetical protein FRB96_008867 [Tulasnella sp. 330]|nr:hypothetical protein FRB96_008867 [Tulasnella sp. 330]